MDSLDKWYDSAIINGKEWYICVFGGNECNEVEDSEDLMRDHLRTQHGLQTSVNLVDNPLLTPSPSLQSGDDINPKCVTSDEEAADNSDHSMGAESDCGQSYASDRLPSGHSMTNRSPDGPSSARPKHMSDKREQRRHECPVKWCNVSRASRAGLKVHLGHHRCGFGFDNTPGADPVTGVCRRANINSFVKTICSNDGQKRFECLSDGCDYHSTSIAHMKDHIHGRHVCPNRSNLIGRSSGRTSRVSATDETRDDSRHQSSPSVQCFQSDEDLDPKCETSDEEESGGHNMDVQSDSSGDERCDSDGATGGQTSAVKKGKRSTDGQPVIRKRYKCLEEGCDHRSPSKAELKLHVREEHPDYESDRQQREFPCDRPNCRVSYSTNARLVRHLANHRCGYQMDDTPDQVSHPSEVCRRAYIDSQYKTKRTAKDVKMYECGFDDCPYSTSGISSIRDHIHGIHVCPNRASLRAPKPRGRKPGGGSTLRVSNTRQMDASSDEESDDNSEASEYNLILSSAQRMSQRIRKQSVSQESNAIETTEEANVSVGRTQPACQTTGQSAVGSDHSDSDLDAGLPNVSPDYMDTRSKSSGSDRPENQSIAHSSGGQSLMPNKRNRSANAQPMSDSKRVYACQHKGCRFKTHSNKILTRHVTDQHSATARERPFHCHLKGCYSSYSHHDRLNKHLANHRCGYNMDEMLDQVRDPSDACRRANIDFHCERSAVTTDGQKSFKCPFDGCDYNTTIVVVFRDHIHGQHVCPNRSNLRSEPKTGRPSKCQRVEKRTTRERTVSSARRADTSSDDDSDGESDASEEAVESSPRKRSSQRIANTSVRQKRSAVQTSRETAVNDAQTRPVASTSRQSVVAKLKAKRNRNPWSSDRSSSGRDSDRDIWSTGSEAAAESDASDSNWSENGSTTSRGGHKSAKSKKHKRSEADQPAIVTNSSALYECGREYCDFTAADKEVLARHMTDNHSSDIDSDDGPPITGTYRGADSSDDQNDDNREANDASDECDSDGWSDFGDDNGEDGGQDVDMDSD